MTAQPPKYQVKICGLSTAESVLTAVEAGASHIGFVFYPPSPRNISPQKAVRLAELIPDHIVTTGVFVNPTDKELEDILRQVPLKLIQLHGQESPDRVAHIRKAFSLPVMKAIAIAGADDILAAKAYETVADLFLFDAKAPAAQKDALPGGNGLAFDWTLIRNSTWQIPWMLSGGLDSTNVAEAMTISGAEGVDVSSGVEIKPGEKDIEKIKAFLHAATQGKKSKDVT